MERLIYCHLTTFFLKIACCLCKYDIMTFPTTTEFPMQTCPEEESSSYQVKWPATGFDSCTYSYPPCVNELMEFEERCCTSKGVWEEEPKCFYIQEEIKQCPEGFFYDPELEICYVILNGTTFPPNCPFEDSVPFFNLVSIINQKIKIGPFWLPVRRDRSNGFGFLQWVEASGLYKEYFPENRYIGINEEKDCVLYVSSSHLNATSCDEEHNSICGYHTLQRETPTNQLCLSDEGSLCRQSDFSAKSKCVCRKLTSYNESYIKAEFPKPYQNTLYSTSKPNCLFGLERTENGTYIWSHSKTQIEYTNWSPNVIFDEKHKYGVISTSGWELSEDNSLQCFLFEKEVDGMEPLIDLTVNGQEDTFYVIVTNWHKLKWLDDNQQVLLFCFTDASSLDPVKRISLKRNTAESHFLRTSPHSDLLYQFTTEASEGPGHYWCESLKYPDLEIIKTDTIFIRQEGQFGPEFSSIMIVKYQTEANALNENITVLIHNSIKETFGNDAYLVKFYKFRVMKLLNVDFIHYNITVNVHLTSVARDPTPDPQDEYELLKELLRDNVSKNSKSQLSLLSFTSSYFCIQEVTESSTTTLTWPTVRIGTTITSEEFCFVQGVRIRRTCIGNFLEGANWEDIDEPTCDDATPIFSNVTNNLIDIVKGNLSTDEVINNTTELCENYQQFVPVDIYLFGEILYKIHDDPSVDLKALSDIVSNIHEVKKSTLKTAQQKMAATDNILRNFDEILVNSQAVEDNGHVEYTSNNIVIVISKLEETDISGLAVIRSNSESEIYEIKVLYGKVNSEEVVKLPNFEAAIVLSDELKQQMKDYDAAVILTLLMKDVLFNEDNEETEKNKVNYGKVFSVIFPKSHQEKFLGPISIFFKTEGNMTKEQDCVYWLYGETNSSTISKGIWMKDSHASNDSVISQCDFWHTTHFALLLTQDSETIRKLSELYFLDLITYICSGFSFFGLFAIFFTAVLFKQWRRKAGNQILINFCLSISLQLISFFSSSSVVDNETLCIIMGIILHYSVISQFCWMFFVGFLQFKRFVVIMGGPPKFVLIKAYLCGWALPLIPVLCVYISDNKNYTTGNIGLCYPTGMGLYLGVWLPLVIIISINIVLFVYILYHVIRRQSSCPTTNINGDVLFQQWKLAVLLFFMLGLTWNFGILAELNLGVAFFYLFCATATLPGFVVFLFFIVFNESTGRLYINFIKSRMRH